MSRLVVLDRDGTIIQERPYLSDQRDVALLPGAAEALRALPAAGFRLAVVSNQSGVGRGYFGLDAVERVNRRLRELLAARGVEIDAFYVCPHAPAAGCACRKPGTALLERAISDAGGDPRGTFVVGDKACDIEMGRRAGATTFLVRTGWGRKTERQGASRPHFVVDDLTEVARRLTPAVPLPAPGLTTDSSALTATSDYGLPNTGGPDRRGHIICDLVERMLPAAEAERGEEGDVLLER
ncbi:MAG TPA: HAD-IIIA family hydrolase [Dehalococcoidia bacterium]|nr:HAD-IIIA family hydrolase [Dehalococcoidia bacterium]